MGRLAAFSFALLLGGCVATHPVEKDRPFTNNSDNAAILFVTEPSGVDPAFGDRWTYTFQREAYAIGHGTSATGYTANVFNIESIGQSDDGRQFHLVRVEPGKYVLTSLIEQRNWALCYAQGTVEFEVAKGRVTFVGLLNPRPDIRRIHAAVTAGAMPEKVRVQGANGLNVQYVYDAEANLRTPDTLPGWQEAVHGFLAARFKLLTADVVVPAFRPVRFADTSDKLGLYGCGLAIVDK
jgi:hypothetical protein